jgi:hypothetical protein
MAKLMSHTPVTETVERRQKPRDVFSTRVTIMIPNSLPSEMKPGSFRMLSAQSSNISVDGIGFVCARHLQQKELMLFFTLPEVGVTFAEVQVMNVRKVHDDQFEYSATFQRIVPESEV